MSTPASVDNNDLVTPWLPIRDNSEKQEIRALTRAIQRANGFSLLFACCDQNTQRQRVLHELSASFPENGIQEVPLWERTDHLLGLLRERVSEPKPAAICVYGMEAWMTEAEASSSPFVLNLNASRNYFLADLPFPLILWLPNYLLRAVMQGASDFFSVKSGIYNFAEDLQTSMPFARKMVSTSYDGILAMPYVEKLVSIEAQRQHLKEFMERPAEQLDPKLHARILTALGELYFTLGAYSQAETLFQQAYEINLAKLGTEDQRTASSMSRLARLYFESGRYPEAERMGQRALEARERILGRNSAPYATALNRMAMLAQVSGEYETAHSLYEDALAIRERKLGKNHPDTISSVALLGTLYDAMGRYPEAEEYLIRSLAMREDVLGPEHPHIAHSLDVLARHYYLLGRIAEAMPLLQRALPILKRAGGTRHPDVALVSDNYAIVLEAVGRADEALRFKKTAEAIRWLLENPVPSEERFSLY